MNSKINKPIVYVGLFLVISGISYYAFNQFIPTNTTKSETKTSATPSPAKKPIGVLTFSGPKTEVCPVNGELFTKEEKDLWSKRRPLLVMIENHADSRPQSGLSNADIVYEAVAEGGITRFMAVFYCNVLKGASNKYDVGPVRSARTYFLDLASEYSDYPLYTHVGGANCSAAVPGGPCTTNSKALAIEQIQSYGWDNKGTWSDLNEFSLSYKICRREPDRTGKTVDTEHTMYCSTNELWKMAEDRGLTNQTLINKTNWDKNYRSWSFKEKDQPNSAPAPSAVSFGFWSGYADYAVTWKYNQSTNSYVRQNGSQPHIDFNTGEVLTTKNVVIQFVKETRSVDTHGHNLYGIIGQGSGLVFLNGTKTEVTWSKATRAGRTIFKDKAGQEIKFVPGQVWIEILPIATAISYEG
jgi:hypothetical protein